MEKLFALSPIPSFGAGSFKCVGKWYILNQQMS